MQDVSSQQRGGQNFGDICFSWRYHVLGRLFCHIFCRFRDEKPDDTIYNFVHMSYIKTSCHGYIVFSRSFSLIRFSSFAFNWFWAGSTGDFWVAGKSKILTRERDSFSLQKSLVGGLFYTWLFTSFAKRIEISSLSLFFIYSLFLDIFPFVYYT